MKDEVTKYICLAGRVLYSLIFIFASFGHFAKDHIDYAANHGVPLPWLAVPVSGIISLIGGLSILLGYKGRWGAALIVLFLVPVTVMMHNFWQVKEAAAFQMQMANFLKNTSMLGAALMIIYFGTGPISLDQRLPAPRG